MNRKKNNKDWESWQENLVVFFATFGLILIAYYNYAKVVHEESIGTKGKVLQHFFEYLDENLEASDLDEDLIYVGEAMKKHSLEYDFNELPKFPLISSGLVKFRILFLTKFKSFLLLFIIPFETFISSVISLYSAV